MFKDLTKKIVAFGKKDELFLEEDEKDGIRTLVTMYPEFWNPLKKVIYSRMNAYSRKLVTSQGDDIIKIQSKILELDNLIKDILEIKPSNNYSSKIKKQNLNNTIQKHTKNTQSQDNLDVMNYIKSNDVRDNNGQIRLSA